MKLEELAGWLFGRTSGGIRWGLERTRELLRECGDPHTSFRALHIGGTNGKGSVAALCASALAAPATRRVGLYTSPHLVSFTERIQIDGRPVEAEAVLAAAERLKPAIERTGATFFEATTAIAFLCLAEARVEVAVVEVGLGGRLDATNVLQPEAVAITNVALEHTDYLGDSLAGIAAEKAGILKPGVPAVTAERDPELLGVLREHAARVGAPLSTLEDLATLEAWRSGSEGTHLRFRSVRWGEVELTIPLVGAYQVRNAMLAAELLALLPPRLRPSLTELRAGFAAVRWPGRLQLHRQRGTTWIFDVAHNPAGVEVLREALAGLDLPRPLVLVAGILADKHWDEMLPPLLATADSAILTVPPSAPPSRRWAPEQAAAALQPRHATPLRAIRDFERALEHAARRGARGTVLVTGSIHTVGDAMRRLGLTPFGNIPGAQDL